MQPIDKPWKQLKKAESYIEKMSNAATLDDYEESWKDFLHNLERAWNKLVSHLKRSPKYQGWIERGKTEKKRRQDQLLSYLVNARGAEEHAVSDITSQEAGGVGINPAVGNSLFINMLEIKNGQMLIDSEQSIKIEFIPGKVILLPIENRGKRYDVPATHLGEELENSSPVDLAKKGIEFYHAYFEKVEKQFVK